MTDEQGNERNGFGGQAQPTPRQAQMIASLRSLANPRTGGNGPAADDAEEHCELCSIGIPENHRHMLHLVDRRIICVCSTCWAQRSGDADLRPTGSRIIWMEDFNLPEETWAKLGVPIGLAFFMRSTVAGAVVAMYPSPAGATESELDLIAWSELEDLNPLLRGIEPDAEALVVNRISDPHQFAVAPIDDCYGLVGAIKMNWEGISGGPALEEAVPKFFEDLRRRAGVGVH